MATKSVSYRNGRGYTVTIGEETWPNCRLKTMPDPQGGAAAVQTDNGPEVLSHDLQDLGEVSVVIPQDDDTPEGYRISKSVIGAAFQRTGEKTRVYFINVTRDGGARLEVESVSSQERTIVGMCHSRGAIVTETVPGGTDDVAYTGSMAATGLKNSGTAETYTWALKTGDSLPAGLSIASNGAITGTPTTAGTTTGYFKLTDSASRVAYIPFSITIAAAA
jgi:hypothetical protein